MNDANTDEFPSDNEYEWAREARAMADEERLEALRARADEDHIDSARGLS